MHPLISVWRTLQKAVRHGAAQTDGRSLVTRPASLLLDHLPLSEHVRHTLFIKFKHESLLINRDRQQVGVGTVDSEGGKKLI